MPKFLDVPQWYESGSTRLFRAAVPIVNAYTKTGSAGGAQIAFKLTFSMFPGDGMYIGFYAANSDGSSDASDFYFGNVIFIIENNSISFSMGMIWASNKNGAQVGQTSGGYFTNNSTSLQPIGDQNIIWGLDLTSEENFIFFKVA